MTNFNERTNTLYENHSSHTIFERVYVGCVWEVSWRRRQTATYWPKVFLATIAALHPHLGWAAQPWVAEGPSPLSGAGSHSAGMLSPTATGTELELTNRNWLTQAVCGTWLYNCLTSTCFLWAYASAPNSTTSTGQGVIPISSTGCTCLAYLHRCISWLTARWRVIMLHIYKFQTLYQECLLRKSHIL